MDAERMTRAIAALKALLIPHAREELTATRHRLDTMAPIEPSSDPIDT